MALVVEDGSGLTNSESYASVAEATAYHAAYGNAAWAALASDTVREQYLRRATLYLKQVYRTAWAGARKTAEQALDWPRVWVPIPDLTLRVMSGYYPSGYFPDSAVPQDVKVATMILALRAHSGPLLPDLERTVKSESVGPISVTYADDVARQYPIYSEVDNLLEPWMSGNGGRILRA